jgi:hypothetical protein
MPYSVRVNSEVLRAAGPGATRRVGLEDGTLLVFGAEPIELETLPPEVAANTGLLVREVASSASPAPSPQPLAPHLQAIVDRLLAMPPRDLDSTAVDGINAYLDQLLERRSPASDPPMVVAPPELISPPDPPPATPTTPPPTTTKGRRS